MSHFARIACNYGMGPTDDGTRFGLNLNEHVIPATWGLRLALILLFPK